MKEETVYEGNFLRVKKAGKWEFAERNNCNGAVVIVPITDDDKLILVEQFRPPIGAQCIEFPAVLVGDHNNKETTLEAAKKELFEEAGYEADEWLQYGEFYSSPGLVNEVSSYCLASDLNKVGDGGGVDSENIIVHEVDYKDIFSWLQEQKAKGKRVSSSVTSGLAFSNPFMLNRMIDRMEAKDKEEEAKARAESKSKDEDGEYHA